ncbi:MAG: hypothetical protein ABR909_03650 [Candidatus Bathyarchaeia archaeon]|jgi:hypothetical protein
MIVNASRDANKMQVEGCEKLTKANIIIIYGLSSEDAKLKTKFHDELYGRNKDGFLSKIPHRKLTDGVIEISQRNLEEVKTIFEKYPVNYQLRITIPVRDTEQILQITKTIEDPYEKALGLEAVGFSKFMIDKLEKISKQEMEKEDLLDELLAIKDTVQKWIMLHQEEPLAAAFSYMFKALELTEGKSLETIRRDVSRIAESLKHWTIGYQVLKESKDTESIDEVLKKYKAKKEEL